MATLGIDLGTSNSAAALLREGSDKAIMVEPSEGKSDYGHVYPSYVAFDSVGEVAAVGLPAKERYRRGGMVVRHFKRLMGRTYAHVLKEIASGNRSFLEFRELVERGEHGEIILKIGPKKYPVSEIASFLLGKIKEDAEAMASRLWQEDIMEVIISVPASWEDDQRKDTKKAAEMAGFPHIKVVEEPTAAALAHGLNDDEEGSNIAVLDIGAGTSDIVIGHITRIGERIRLVMSKRNCDDLLGGMDMDARLLEYIMEEDRISPRLSDIYLTLDHEEKHRLLAKIEEAKIEAALDGRAKIAMVLRANGGTKRLNLDIDEQTLNQVVGPLIVGHKTADNRLKGVKPLLERTLLDVAGGDDRKIAEVKGLIKKLILVGGPCRMRLMQHELKKVFQANDKVCQELETADPLNPFFMEAVATGAAISTRLEYHPTITHTISLFHWAKGRKILIEKDTPYSTERGISRTVGIPVERGRNLIYVVTEKDRNLISPSQWTMRRHIVNVPIKGELSITLHWNEGGTESSKSLIKGAGLQGVIEFPEAKEINTLGEFFESTFKEFLFWIKDIRNRIEKARKVWTSICMQDVKKMSRNPSYSIILRDSSIIDSQIKRFIDERLSLSDYDIRKCEALDPESSSRISDEDVELALSKGYFEARDSSWCRRLGFEDRIIKVVGHTSVSDPKENPVTAEVLIQFCEAILVGFNEKCKTLSFYRQLDGCLAQTKRNPNENTTCTLANALAALLDELRNNEAIDGELYSIGQYIAFNFNPRD